jgi:tetratricopeptide (TPR) repeat protein
MPKPVPTPKTSAVRWHWAALLLLAFAAYCNSFSLGIAFDAHAMTGDRRVQAATLENVRLIFVKDYWWPAAQDHLYRPFTTLSYLVNTALFGNSGYHALNFLLHTLNVLLVYALARRLFRAAWPAFFAAALWAVHPVGVDVVTNVAGRADLLAALGVLAGLVLYARYCEGRGRAIAVAAGIFACALLAAGSKENGTVLIGLMLLWDVVHGFGAAAGIRRRLPAYGAAAAALAVYAGLRFHAFQALPVPILAVLDNPLRAGGFWEARWTALKIVGMDLALLLWPANLAADRSFRQIPLAGAADPGAWISAAVVAAILAAVIVRRRRDPLLFWAAGFFGIALLPVSNLAVLIGAPMAERFLYLPSIGFAAAIAALVYRFAPPRPAALALGAAVVLLAGRTLARNPQWDNDLALTSHDVAVAPNSFRLRAMYGEFLFQASPSNVDRAIAQEEIGWAMLAPLPAAYGYPQIPASLGRLYGAKGDQMPAGSPERAAWHAKALALNQRAAAISDATQKAFDEAQLQAGKPLPPLLPYQNVYLFLALGYQSLGRYSESIAAYRRALAMNPSDAGFYNGIAQSYTAMGDSGGAAVTYLEYGLASGLTPETMNAIAAAYEKAPGGACAVNRQSGVPTLDPGCARVPADICRAYANLVQTYTNGRDPARTAEFRTRAVGSNCRIGERYDR